VTKLICYLSLLFFFFCCDQSSSPNKNYAQDVILNGNFEDSLDFWGTRGSPSIRQENALLGNNCLFINSDYENYTYIYQNFSHPLITLEATFWVFPTSEEYDQMIQFLANWPGEDIDFIISIGFRTESFSCRSLDSLIILPPALNLNSWNQISVKSLSTGFIEVYTNNKLKCSFFNSAPIPIETIMIGDVSRNKNYGQVYYDAVSVLSTEVYFSD